MAKKDASIDNFDSIVDGLMKAVDLKAVNLQRGSYVQNTLPSGSLALDLIMGGGWPGGRWSVAFGGEGCLSGDSFVQYEVRHPDGRRANHKGGTIENLYHRFNNIEPDPRVGRPPVNAGMEFFASSVNEAGRVVKNKIVRVIKTGRKQTFHVTTESGHTIRATKDHRFYVGEGQYSRLHELAVGSTVFIHNNTPFTTEAPRQRHHLPEIMVKSHPHAPEKLVDGRYLYYRLAHYRAVVEAAMNNLTLDEFVARLNNHDLNDLTFLQAGQHVHHKNEDPMDDRIENLQIIDGAEHNRHHAHENHNDLRFMAVASAISSISEAEGVCDTYDLTMEGPHHNYIADGIVVHNSGKSTLSFFAMDAAVKADVPVFHFDPEGAADPSYMNRIGLKVDWSKEAARGEKVLYRYIQPDYGEQVFRVIKRIMEALPDSDPADHNRKIQAMFVIDSLPFLQPQRRFENDEASPMAQQARMYAENIGMIKSPLSQKNCVLYAVNQIRMKPGVSYGSPIYEPCGETPKHASDLRLKMTSRSVPSGKGGPVEEEACWDGRGTDKYVYAICRTIKNKMFSPFRETWIRIWFEERGMPGRGVDPFYDTYQYLTMTAQLVEKRGYFEILLPGYTGPERITWAQFKTLVLDPKNHQEAGLNIRDMCRAQFGSGDAFKLYFSHAGGQIGEAGQSEDNETPDKPSKEEVVQASEEAATLEATLPVERKKPGRPKKSVVSFDGNDEPALPAGLVEEV